MFGAVLHCVALQHSLPRLSLAPQPAQRCMLAWSDALHVQGGDFAGALPLPWRCFDGAAEVAFHAWCVCSCPSARPRDTGPGAAASSDCASARRCPTACALRSARSVSASFVSTRNQAAMEPLALTYMRPTLHPGGHAAPLARLLLALITGVQRLRRDQVPLVQLKERFDDLLYVLWASRAPQALSGCAAPCSLPPCTWQAAIHMSKAMLCIIPEPGHCSPKGAS